MSSCNCNSTPPDGPETPDKKTTPYTRRALLRDFLRGAGVVSLAAVTAGAIRHSESPASDDTVWQIDPEKCIQCGRCATTCAIQPSAVKCVHAFDLCGYCDICTGYYLPQPVNMDNITAAENLQCPTDAVIRTFIEGEYYEYHIDESRCIGCGKCVAGCGSYGNGSLYLQIIRTRCKNCNDCTIANACLANAISRVPASPGYIIKGPHDEVQEGQSE